LRVLFGKQGQHASAKKKTIFASGKTHAFMQQSVRFSLLLDVGPFPSRTIIRAKYYLRKNRIVFLLNDLLQL